MNTFESLNTQVRAIGNEIGRKFYEDSGTESIRTLRDEVEVIYNTMIDQVKRKVDYSTWYSAFVTLNKTSRYHVLDTTGEFTRLVDELLKLDATEYYTNTILPMFDNGERPLIKERNWTLSYLDNLIAVKNKPSSSITGITI